MRRMSMLGSACLAVGVIVGTAAVPASAATGAEICGGSEYVFKYHAYFTGGVVTFTKNRNSTTWCAVTIKSDGVRRYTSVELSRVPYKSGVTAASKKDAGNYTQYAGPLYLAHYPDKDELYAVGRVGDHGAQIECVQSTCGTIYKW